jgi:nicotinamide mononucleotide (NMN) deamidase PncC
MSWLMADAEGTVAEPGIDSTVMELPAGVKEQLKQDIAAGPPADVGGGGGLPEPDAGAVAAAMQKTSESKRDTREAATDILAKYLDRRRVVK